MTSSPAKDAWAPRYDYVVVGHVTCDELADGSRRAGGSALYSGLQAARLGLRTLILTQGQSEEIQSLLEPFGEELDVATIAAEQTTTLATGGHGGRRRQRLLAWAGEIVDPPIPAGAGIVHLAPVARELGSIEKGDDFVITPQGLLRRWRPRTGEVFLSPLSRGLLPRRFAAAVLSEHELPFCEPLLDVARACGACVAITAGGRPAALRLPDGSTIAGPQPPALAVRDDLGAGDVFAAAFFVALAEARDPLAAASFATAAAAIRLGGVGAQAIGTREQIEALTV